MGLVYTQGGLFPLCRQISELPGPSALVGTAGAHLPLCNSQTYNDKQAPRRWGPGTTQVRQQDTSAQARQPQGWFRLKQSADWCRPGERNGGPQGGASTPTACQLTGDTAWGAAARGSHLPTHRGRANDTKGDRGGPGLKTQSGNRVKGRYVTQLLVAVNQNTKSSATTCKQRT